MFRENNNHKIEPLFSDVSQLDLVSRQKLKDGWPGLFYREVFQKIDERAFAGLYSDSGMGAPNFPVNVLLGAEILKHWRDLTDEILFEETEFNLQYAYALGYYSLADAGIKERTLYDFRHAIYVDAVMNKGNESLIYKQFVKLTGHLCKLGDIDTAKLRMDSTQILPNIANAGRLGLTFDVLLHAVKSCPEELLSPSLSEVLVPSYRTTLIFRAKSCESISRLEILLNLGGELLFLLKNRPDVQECEEIKTLKRFLSEQSVVTTTESGAKKRIAREPKDIPSNSLQSAHDTDATYRTKGKNSYRGHVVNITETASKKNKAQFVQHYSVEQNIKSDCAMLAENIAEIKKVTGATLLVADGGYNSPTVDEAMTRAGVELKLTDMTGKKPDCNKLLLTEYKYNDNLEITECPNGQVPIRSNRNGNNISTHFALEQCQNCPKRDDCQAKKQKKNYVVYVSVKAIESARKRAEIKADKKDNTSDRAAIEGTISAADRKQGLGAPRVRGLNKCETVTGMKLIGRNFQQYMRIALNKIRTTKNKLVESAVSSFQGITAPILPDLIENPG